MAPEEVLKEVRSITMEVLGPYHVGIYLFGSRAKGTASAFSDVDIAVDPHQPLPCGLMAVLRERFEESHIPYKVEVADLSSSKPAFRAQVMKGAIVWKD